ncbi:hypothetical protein [Pollutibacter soli]|uniref:hypothetical protein n=1 Tax=Pollutibacter soli TaxID=3034157 RepID=UPI003013ECE1
MKKLFIISAAAIISAGAAHAQSSVSNADKHSQENPASKKEKKEEHKKHDVSSVSMMHFKEDFENAQHVSWQKEGAFDVASFTKNGKPLSAYYDTQNKLVGTTSQASFSDIPARAQQIINSKYADYTKKEVILFDDEEDNETDMALYGQSFEDKDNYFIELTKGSKTLILQSDMEGNISFFKEW